MKMTDEKWKLKSEKMKKCKIRNEKWKDEN